MEKNALVTWRAAAALTAVGAAAAAANYAFAPAPYDAGLGALAAVLFGAGAAAWPLLAAHEALGAAKAAAEERAEEAERAAEAAMDAAMTAPVETDGPRRAALEHVQEEIRAIIAAMGRGELNGRISVRTDNAFCVEVAEGVNQICAIIDRVTADLLRTLAALAEGDLTNRMAAPYGGRFEALASAANASMDRLSAHVGEIKEMTLAAKRGSAEVALASTELTKQFAARDGQVAAAVGAIGRVEDAIRANAANAGRARALSSRATESATRGGSVAKRATAAMSDVEKSAARITEIVGVIDGIAFQTNLLALNAAVEAARAGESGKGFAVVATEVRNLAQRSADAARDVARIVTESTKQIGAGVTLVEQTGAALDEIGSASRDLAVEIDALAGASDAQSDMIRDAARTVQGFNSGGSAGGAALARQSAQAAERLTAEANRLDDLAAMFRADERRALPPTETDVEFFTA